MAIVTLIGLTSIQCNSHGEILAAQMCREVKTLESKDPRKALSVFKKMWETLPTTGTRNATECGRHIRKKMGLVRSLIKHDKQGDEETIAGCMWASEAVDLFKHSVNPPFRPHWANNIIVDCRTIVGRAWAKFPDSNRLSELNARLENLAEF